ncbi:unnamed protein product [Peniophora sp. CBMAI 1063]|nr:unnamed protein product [Peniophora sp. CBMAI 1063]
MSRAKEAKGKFVSKRTISLKSADGRPVDLDNLRRNVGPSPVSAGPQSPSVGKIEHTRTPSRPVVRMETPEQKKAREAAEEEKAKKEREAKEKEERAKKEAAEKREREEREKKEAEEKAKREAEEKVKKEKEEAERKAKEEAEAAERAKKEAEERKRKEEEEAAAKAKAEEEAKAKEAAEKKAAEEAAAKAKADEEAKAKAAAEPAETEEGEIVEDKEKKADDNSIAYPEGIQSPKLELNVNASKGKFKYDRDFLLQFMAVCKDKPDNLPPLDAIGLEPSDQAFSMARGGSGRRASGMQTPSSRSNPIGLGFGPIGKAGMGNFAMPAGAASKLSSEERFAMASRPASTSGAGMPRAGAPPLARISNEGGPGGDRRRTRSSRGHARGKNRMDTIQQPLILEGADLPEPDVEVHSDLFKSEVVVHEVEALLDQLTVGRFDSISDQIIEWTNQSEREKDARTLTQVIRVVYEKAMEEAAFSEVYARLCRKMMEQISTKVQDDGMRNNEGTPFAGGQLFRKLLLSRCKEDFERVWVATDPASAAGSNGDDANARVRDRSVWAGVDDGNFVPYSDEYRTAAARTKRRGIALVRFIGELFKLRMLTERIMHECIKKLLRNASDEHPEADEIEGLCVLLTTIGSILDTPKARAHMDVHFARMKKLAENKDVDVYTTSMLQDVIELRENKWRSRNKIVSDEWAIAGAASGTSRAPPQASDLSKFGQINKQQFMTFGPKGVFARAQKDGAGSHCEGNMSRAAGAPRTMFDMLSGAYAPEAPVITTSSRPPSRVPYADLSQADASDAPMQRRKLNLLPRSKAPHPEKKHTEEAKRKVGEDVKELFSLRSVDEVESYFTSLPAERRWLLVDAMCMEGIERQAADVLLVTALLARARVRSLASLDAFEKGFEQLAELLDDIAINGPKAFKTFADWMRAAGLAEDEERRTRIAEKLSEGRDKLLGLLAYSLLDPTVIAPLNTLHV